MPQNDLALARRNGKIGKFPGQLGARQERLAEEANSGIV